MRKGDDASRVTELLGTPNGFMETSQQGIYYYDRGEVHTRKGIVSHIYLISEAELAERNRLNEEFRLQRKIEGEAAFEAIMAQGGIEHLSGTEQVRFWDSFRAQFPEVDIRLPYAEALTLARTEQKEEAAAERLARLEERVLQAELRAARAQEQAAQAQAAAATAQNQNQTRIITPYYWGGSSGFYIPPRSQHISRSGIIHNRHDRAIGYGNVPPRLTRDTILTTERY